MTLSDKNFVRLLSARLEPFYNAICEESCLLSAIRLQIAKKLAKKLVGCRGPDFGYFRYRG